jgi:hypothetical protein
MKKSGGTPALAPRWARCDAEIVAYPFGIVTGPLRVTRLAMGLA